MKKMMLIAAVAFAAISCGSKATEEQTEEAQAPAVEVVEEAPAAQAEPAAAEEEKSLLQRAVELGEDVAAEVEKQK